MARPPSKNPTEFELELLQIIWDQTQCTVSEVQEELQKRSRKLAYTSIAKILGIMVDKGYLSRKKTGREFTYSPLVSAEQTQSTMLSDLLGRVFGGSPSLLLNRLMAIEDVSEEEIQKLRSEINASQRRKRKKQGK